MDDKELNFPPIQWPDKEGPHELVFGRVGDVPNSALILPPPGGFSADNPPPLLTMPSQALRDPLTPEEYERALARLRDRLSQIPWNKQQIEQDGDRFLRAWLGPLGHRALNL